MPSEMVPAQQLSDAGEDLVRLAAAKDAEINQISTRLRRERIQVAALKADFQNACDAADAYHAEIAALTEQRDMWKASYDGTCELFHAKCAEIARLRNTIGWEASVAYRTEIAALTEAVEYHSQDAARLLTECNSLTEQRDRAMKVVEAARAAYRAHPRYGHIPVGLRNALGDALAALDADAAAETGGKDEAL